MGFKYLESNKVIFFFFSTKYKKTMALDLMLKSLVKSTDFNDMPDKNWTSISKLIPGTTPKQVVL